MPIDAKQMREELELLQLEELRESAEERKAKRSTRLNKIRAIEMSLKRTRDAEAYTQSRCKHLKGGKGRDGIFNGNDANYAVITHTLSHGPTIVVCQRCGKLWEPPERPGKKASAEVREKYFENVNEYRRALAFPTDNEPSGTNLFEIIREDDAA
jgi:hypothetical protein